YEFEGRCLGLAGTSGMLAILVHSVVDFNLYIPANGLVLAWISGISAALQFSSHPTPVWKALGVPPVVEVGGSVRRRFLAKSSLFHGDRGPEPCRRGTCGSRLPV